MAGGQGVRGAVKADVEDSLAVVDDIPDLLLVGHLGDEAPGLQFFVTGHSVSFSFILRVGGIF